MTNYITPTQFAESLGVTRQLVNRWLNQRRIKGARSVTDASGRVIGWKIPADAKRPDNLTPGRKPEK